MQAQNLPEANLHHHTSKIKEMLNDVVNHLREDITKVSKPKVQALFEEKSWHELGSKPHTKNLAH